MTDDDARATASGGQRVAALVLLLAAGVMSLPVCAFFLDGEGTENLIVPVQLVTMALVGAVVGAVLPGLARPGSSRGRAVRVGVLLGIGAAVLGVAVFFVLISGFGA